MSDNQSDFVGTPVAEYKGVALIEKKGDKRTAWHGTEYSTDGCVYFVQRDPHDAKTIILLTCDPTTVCEDGSTPADAGIGAERIAKHAIDAMTTEERNTHLSFLEALTCFGCPEVVVAEWTTYLRQGGGWRWDEEQQVFVEIGPDDSRPLRDGQHRFRQ